jgi:hypothetical protein
MNFSPDSGQYNIWMAGSRSADVDTAAFDKSLWTMFIARQVFSYVGIDKADTRSGWTDETANRSLDTWYQNTTDSDLDVAVSVQASADATRTSLRPHENTSQTNNILWIEEDDLDTNRRMSVTMTVPAGHYYKVGSGGDTGNFSLEYWSEQS